MLEILSADKYQQMAARIMSQAAYNAETLASALQTQKKVVTKILTKQPIASEIQIRLVKLFCRTCK